MNRIQHRCFTLGFWGGVGQEGSKKSCAEGHNGEQQAHNHKPVSESILGAHLSSQNQPCEQQQNERNAAMKPPEFRLKPGIEPVLDATPVV